MNISFTPLRNEHAEKIILWRYQAPYHIYDYRDQSPQIAIEYLAKPANRFFAVLRDEELIAFRSFGPDGRVPGGVYDESCLDTGGGLRPDLTGHGLGSEIILKGIEFGIQEFESASIRVTIAAFNERAQCVCKRIGFTEKQRFYKTDSEEQFVILTLNKNSRTSRSS